VFDFDGGWLPLALAGAMAWESIQGPEHGGALPHVHEDRPAMAWTPAHEIPVSGAPLASGAAVTRLPLGWIPGQRS
jgi:hypothetical protein